MASTSKIRDKEATDIQEELDELREQLFKLRWQAATGQVENPNRIREVKRDIARHLTILREKEAATSSEDSGRAAAAPGEQS